MKLTREIKRAYIQAMVTEVGTDVDLSAEFEEWLEKERTEGAVEALRSLAEAVRSEWASNGMLCPWVGALDDEIANLERDDRCVGCGCEDCHGECAVSM